MKILEDASGNKREEKCQERPKQTTKIRAVSVARCFVSDLNENQPDLSGQQRVKTKI